MSPGLVPALMQVSASSGAIVAKWASENGCVVIDQTERLLRVSAPPTAFIAPLVLPGTRAEPVCASTFCAKRATEVSATVSEIASAS